MSQPRSIVPGATYLLTRRALRRHLLFRPDAAINQLVLYTLAVSARRFGIQVHALCMMSTHLHLVVTDTLGVLPKFLQFFHRLIALGTKVLRAWEGSVWDNAPTSVVHLLTPAAVVEKIAYTMANPVAAGLVKRAHDWPGAKVLVDELGGALSARRPEAYFDATNPQWPNEAELALSLPPYVAQDAADDFRQKVRTELERHEADARTEVERQGFGVLGAERASAASPYDRATSDEPLRDRNPTFAVGRGQPGAWQRAAAAVRAFRAAYREALAQWRIGVRTVVFPTGTWCMRVLHAVCVDDVAQVGDVAPMM
ncbi:transposase [Sorangium cellulosum]|uniref:Transposase n=1 Tax=Sorangium cellulosum TaxID=56 RepID=A0A2L0F9I0_SORCE|nr:transposase [Sorangium cellulosum]AUX48193.1 transposase [Sorangium cellulosum]